MVILGLTGGIASGKSTVSGMLKDMGAYIVDADKLAREIAAKGKPTWREIVNRFGDGILDPNGEIDRKRLGQMVFADEVLRKELENITHPRIKEAAYAEIEKAKADGYKVIVIDAPLLIEAGWEKMVQTVWVVYVDENTQITRLLERDKISLAAALTRIRAQMPLKEKINYADVVIDNSKGLDNTLAQVMSAWRDIKHE
ncbi:MAG TPA: dephospho-CoA kinase [Methylomusa anaerophila]|uniref:Dephospho-CoA kinase n=1 Tax=Methylomusa anaerophila TaxID=1930071 RepID=A0A348AQP1_9FIRM|nr:dephospho-CoA kinase [Methylomusa anaerophila]BBB93389.1 dephospho-CoA kinase [Methylomusa anaerophila]HML90337.1 dephospho-CoA kinase [Methylomusa anaerophila]